MLGNKCVFSAEGDAVRKQEEDRRLLPAPVQLSPEQVKQIAAGTAGLLPAALLRPPILAGGITVGPVWEGYTAT